MRASVLLVFLPCLLVVASPARAAVPSNPGPRGTAMAGAVRANATGDSALSYNPSGMSLIRSYVIEGGYLLDKVGSGNGHNAHASIVDSTSGFNLAGGLYYTYLTQGREGASHRTAHEVGLALAMPLGERVFIGAETKYLNVHTDSPLLDGERSKVSGFAFDVGLTLKPASVVSLGLSATNLANLQTDRAPRTFGGGLSVSPTSDLSLEFDTVLDLTSGRPVHDQVWHFLGSGEYLIAKSLAVRAGGGRRGDTEAGVLAGGLALVTDAVALDAGLQQDLAGARKETIFAISARIFVPPP
jgi:hypothetical protein